MICARCGTEYEGSQCPKCDGPVIKVNNSDYIARRKAYEEKQAMLNKALQKEADVNINDNADEKTALRAEGSSKGKINKKAHASKSKNYDEGVFDITKVDFEQVADKLKSGKDKLAKSVEEKVLNKNIDKAKTDKTKVDKAKTNRNNKSSKKAGKSAKYTKLGIAVAGLLVIIAATVLIINVVSRKSYNIYMSDGNRVYDVSSLDSKYVCDSQDAVFALDDITFYTPEWPEDIDRNNAVSNVASPDGDYYATDVYDSSNGSYSLYIWSADVCLKVAENSYEHNVYYISDKGMVIYEETETINDNGKTGEKLLSMAEIKKDKTQSGGYICDVNTIERNLNTAYVYSSKDVIIILNGDGRLYQYNYTRKITTEVDMYVDGICALSSVPGMYSNGAEHLNTSDDAASYIYNSSGTNYYVEVKNAKATELKGVSGINSVYVYDSKNGYIYWAGNKKISYARFKNGEITDVAVLENTGTGMNMIYLPDTQELVYVNDASQLVKAEKGKKTFIAEAVRDGSLSQIRNTDASLTYIANGKQYYIKDTSAKQVEICEAGDMVNTSNTGIYKKRVYFYGSDGQLYTCNLKGEARNVIGNVERFFIGSY